ncbi:MAG TPA: YcxB family protein [Mucilaginibacter sp.]
MEDIRITSNIDLKTYFNINLLIAYKMRSLVFIAIVFVFIQTLLVVSPSFDWITEVMFIVIFLLFYGGVKPLILYFACKRNMKKSAYLHEILHYTINENKIECKAESVSTSTTWQYAQKMIEREKYFLLMISARSFHYLPKEGFEMLAGIEALKRLAAEKGVKLSYH